MLRNVSQKDPSWSIGKEESRRMLRMLADDNGRDLLRTVQDAEEPLTVKDMKDCTGIPMSTLYRKLDVLRELDAVRESISIGEHGHHAREYSLAFDKIEVTLAQGGCQLSLYPKQHPTSQS